MNASKYQHEVLANLIKETEARLPQSPTQSTTRGKLFAFSLLTPIRWLSVPYLALNKDARDETLEAVKQTPQAAAAGLKAVGDNLPDLDKVFFWPKLMVVSAIGIGVLWAWRTGSK